VRGGSPSAHPGRRKCQEASVVLEVVRHDPRVTEAEELLAGVDGIRRGRAALAAVGG
jgi:hypothetical protein